MKIGVPKGLNVTTKPTAGEITTITFEKPVYYISIKNKSSSDTLYVSFDMRESWIDIAPGETIEIEPFATKGKPIILLKSDGTNQPVRIIYRFVEGE